MNLSKLAIAAGGTPATTHQERLMVVASAQLPDGDLTFLHRLVESGDLAWMETLLDMGAFDLGATLQSASSSTQVREASVGWASQSRLFLDFFGAGQLKDCPPTEILEKHLQVTFERGPDVLALFDKATFRLASQAAAVRSVASSPVLNPLTTSTFGFLSIDDVDSMHARQSYAIEVTALWAGVACALDRPAALQALIDAFPEAMTAAVPAESTILSQTLRNRSRIEFFGTNALAEQRVSPLFCALHASSEACVKVILDKREAMGLTLDAPLTANKNAKMKPPRSFLETIAFSDAFFDPEMVAEVIQRVLHSQPKEAADELAWRLVQQAETQQNLFALTVPMDIYHGQNTDLRSKALQAAMLHVPKAMPEMLARLDWEQMAPVFLTRESPFMKASSKTKKPFPSHQEAALLALIEKARVDGREDLVFQTYTVEIQDQARVTAPLTMLSAAGFEKTILAFLDHGYDAKAKIADATLSLLEIATESEHPTVAMLHAHAARGKAHQLLREMEFFDVRRPKLEGFPGS